MSRGVAYTTLVTLLKAELRDAQETNTALDAELTYVLKNHEKHLCNAFFWPFLEDKWELTLSPGDRYRDVPTGNIRGISATINFEQPISVAVKFNTFYQPVTYGIGVDEMNASDSGATPPMTRDPVQRWSLDTNTSDSSNPNQIEVWPMPASTQIIRFTGQRQPIQGIYADLDDLLLVYSTAAEYLTDRENAKAPQVVAKTQRHLIRLRQGYPARTCPPVILGGGTMLYQEPKKLIAVT
jgi:hypothetical protein